MYIHGNENFTRAQKPEELGFFPFLVPLAMAAVKKLGAAGAKKAALALAKKKASALLSSKSKKPDTGNTVNAGTGGNTGNTGNSQTTNVQKETKILVISKDKSFPMVLTGIMGLAGIVILGTIVQKGKR